MHKLKFHQISPYLQYPSLQGYIEILVNNIIPAHGIISRKLHPCSIVGCVRESQIPSQVLLVVNIFWQCCVGYELVYKGLDSNQLRHAPAVVHVNTHEESDWIEHIRANELVKKRI